MAVREAIVNAIIHRDYQIKGSEIHIDMFDDRLEIVSPGGMIDGSFIQDLDIAHVSSMRRNRIISDLFSRLHFMERRGSGLTRILESYDDNIEKPKFYSNESSFRVTIPNKNYINEKSNENLQGNLVNDDDYFMLQVLKKSTILTKRTIEQIGSLFNVYKYSGVFKREDIENICLIKKSRALEIIKNLIKADLIVEISKSNYKFKK